MGDLVTQARELADIVLIDSAPMLLANDAMDLMPYVDTVLVVSYAGRATSEQAQRASELLARTRAPVIGLALVGVNGRSYRDLMSYSHGTREDLIAMDLSQRPSPRHDRAHSGQRHRRAETRELMASFDACAERIRTGAATVAVIGQGYVGLTVACAAATAGMRVEAIDVVAERLEALAAGRNVVPGVPDDLFAQAYATGRMRFGSDFSAVGEADVTLICVPTPVTEHRPDLSFIENAARSVAPYVREGALVILESTTYPGTTEQVLRPLAGSGWTDCG